MKFFIQQWGMCDQPLFAFECESVEKVKELWYDAVSKAEDYKFKLFGHEFDTSDSNYLILADDIFANHLPDSHPEYRSSSDIKLNDGVYC